MANVITQIYGCENIIDAQIAAALGADHIGCGMGEVKHLGPKQKSCLEAKAFFDALPENVVRVGLTIATDVDEIINDLHIYTPDVFHLSGDIRDISPEGVQRIRDAFPGLKIMQAIPVFSGVPVEEQWPEVEKLIRAYEDTSDFFLIDTKDPTSTIGIGATGATHDREIDRRIIESTDVKCIIAGGLEHETNLFNKLTKHRRINGLQGFPLDERTLDAVRLARFASVRSRVRSSSSPPNGHWTNIYFFKGGFAVEVRF